MMQRRLTLLVAAFAAVSPAHATEVVWTAQGTVDFSFGGVSALAPVEESVQIEFSYDDSAERVPVSGLTNVFDRVEYRTAVNLRVAVTIGDNTWEGSVVSGPAGGSRTLELIDFHIGCPDDCKDAFFVLLTSAEEAEFATFPGLSGDNKAMNLTFRAEGPDEGEPFFLTSDQLRCVAAGVEAITKASGSVTDGEEAFSFSIDPKSIRTKRVEDRSLSITSISYENEEVTITWPTKPGCSYAVQYLDEDGCWQELFGIFALEEEASETFFPRGFELPKTQLYRIALFE